MAHFAEINQENKVIRVLVIANDACLDEDNKESEEVGSKYCSELFGGRWVQTSYNSNFRKQYAGVDYIFDKENNVFIRPQPFNSWVLNKNFDWEPPIEKPNNEDYYWDENSLSWKNKEI